MQGKPITKDDFQFITDNYINLSDIEIGKEIGRSAAVISNIRSKLKLVRPGHLNIYTQAEIDYIRENQNSMTSKDIALKLCRTTASVCTLKSRLGLTKEGSIFSAKVSKKVLRMKELICICETTNSPYRKDQAKEELKKLSGL